MSAPEVIAQEVWQAYVVELGRSMPEGLADKLAAGVVPALKAAGYAVVELPEPDTFADDYAVVGNEIRHYAPNGFGAYWRFDFDEASTLARALLSLLAAVEATP